MKLMDRKDYFIATECIMLSWQAALQRNKTYIDNIKEDEKKV